MRHKAFVIGLRRTVIPAPDAVTRHIQSDALKLLAWLACTIVLGAALAPLIFKAGKNLVDMRLLDEGTFLGRVAEQSEFSRYFNRAVLLAAVVCLVPLLRSLKFRRSELGLERNPHGLLHFLGGFVLAGGLLLGLGYLYLQVGWFEDEPKHVWEWKKLGTFGSQALGASVLEELLFRGVLLALLMRTMRPVPAAFWLTFAFAAIHFFKPPEGAELAEADVRAGSGFWLIGQIFAQFSDPGFIVAEFATLFAVGAVLVWARFRTRSLWLPMGLHAGWIFCLKLYSFHTRIPKDYRPDPAPPFVGADLKEGLIPLTTVCLTGVIAAIVLRAALRRRERTADLAVGDAG